MTRDTRIDLRLRADELARAREVARLRGAGVSETIRDLLAAEYARLTRLEALRAA